VVPSTPRLCYECQSPSHLAFQCDLRAKKRASKDGSFTVQNKACIALEHGLTHKQCADTIKDSYAIMSDCEKVELTKENCQQSVDVDQFVGQVEIAPLTYLDICINGTRQRALVDSGSQVPLIRADRLQDNPTITGSIYIQGIVGPAVQAKIATLDVTRWEEGVVSPSVKIPQLRIVFAIMDKMVEHDVILPSEVADKLMRSEIDQSGDRSIAWVVDIGGQTTDIVDDKPGMSAGKGKSEISETPNIVLNPCKDGDCENVEFAGLASWGQPGGV
jgi:hypothetical protein